MSTPPLRAAPMLALLFSTLMTACGGGGGGDALPAPPASSPTPPPAQPAPAPAPPPASAAVPTAIGTPIGAAYSATIGPAGGTLSTVDGALTVEVPAGAFDRERVVTLQQISNHAHGAAGRAWRITPEGLNTPQPMTLRFRYGNEELQGSAAPLLAIATQAADGTWRAYRRPTHDAATQTLSIRTRHFSDWSLVRGAQLLPAEAAVNVAQSVDLRVMRCEFDDPTDPNDPNDIFIPLPGTLKKCDSEPLWNTALVDWSVNGVPEGGAAIGTVQPIGDATAGQARYTAPATLPAPNPVAVSVRLPDFFGVGVQTLVSNITVRDPAGACAQMRTREVFDATWGLRYSFAGATAGGDTLEMSIRGDVTARLVAVPGGEGPNGKRWTGPAHGSYQFDSRMVRSGSGRTTTTTGSGAPFTAAMPDEGTHVTLHIDFATCRYSTHFTLRGRTTSITTGDPDPFVQADALLGIAQATAPRTVPADGLMIGSGQFTAHTPLWVVTHDPDDAWVPLNGAPILGGYAAEGQAGSAQVEWAIGPAR